MPPSQTPPSSSICILTAGRGTRMGPYAEIINKCLLPLQAKAVLSHIIQKFPADSEFVIALGYLGDQVRDYLELAHPETHFKFVQVDKFEGTGSGPGHSLLCCRAELQKPFYLVCCDTLWTGELPSLPHQNWIGVARVKREESSRFCNLEVKEGQIVDIQDKVPVDPANHRAFVGFARIQDFNSFWEGLQSPSLIAGEVQISNGFRKLIAEKTVVAENMDWQDVGTLESYIKEKSKYEEFDFSKNSEFFYRVENRVLKFFSDPSISEKRMLRGKMIPSIFPTLVGRRGQFFAYIFEPGETLYENLDPSTLSKLLPWLERNLWIKKTVSTSLMEQACSQFYKDKTNERLKLYFKKYPNSSGESVINGEKIPSTETLLKKIPWERLFSGIPTFMHGDLQPDNIIYESSSEKFKLLDWRQDFSNHLEFGDLYYDFAKLYGGLIVNYNKIHHNQFSYREEKGQITFDLPHYDHSEECLQIFNKFVEERGYDLQKVKIITGLVFLNMSPLHASSFDRLIHSLGRSFLWENLKNLP